jgi:predicted N-acetyltransferase YhbS
MVGELHFSRRLDAQRLIRRVLHREFALADQPEEMTLSLEALDSTGQLVGTSWVRFPEEIYDADLCSAELQFLAVNPKDQRRSVGSALLAQSEKRSRLAGMEELWLQSVPNAVPFYAARGYSPVGGAGCQSARYVSMAKPLLD